MKIQIENWLGHEFESSTHRTPEYVEFEKCLLKEIKDKIKDKYNMGTLSRGHFEVSGFVQNIETKKWVYWSISDVRHFPDQWYKEILVRTAEQDRDWTGGCNNYTTFPKLVESLDRLSA